MSEVEQVVDKLQSGSESATDLKSCDHSSADCPHGDNVNQSNIPWASDTPKLKRTDNTYENNTTHPPQRSNKKQGPGEAEVKDATVPYATESNTDVK